MDDLRLFFIDVAANYRRNFHTHQSFISSSVLTLILFTAVTALTWISAIDVSVNVATVTVYVVALLGIVLGLRVGMLRIGYRSDEYILTKSTRFWRRSLPYLIPAFLLPLPVYAAIVVQLAGYGWTSVLALIGLISNGLMFVVLGSLVGVVIRKISKRLIFRAVILTLAVVAIFSGIDSGLLIFRSTLFFVESITYILPLITLQLAVIILSVAAIDLLIGSVNLTNRPFGRYYPILLSPKSIGYGAGSMTLISTVKVLLRDSVTHRRWAFVVFALMLATTILAASKEYLGELNTLVLVVSFFAIFNAVTVLTTTRALASQINQRVASFVTLSYDSSKITVGSFLGGLIWQLAISVVLWGIFNQWVELRGLDLTLFIVVISQYLLSYGWSRKLQGSSHKSLATITIFGLIILIGLIPSLLWEIAGPSQTIFVQLIWLVFIGILLQLTSHKITEKNYA